jgi:cation diffusion facilitator CzcD-associated flavoprotein CzcO
VRCDIPAHAYQSVFSPNTQWTEEFAQGAEIRDYWQGVARKYNVYQYLRRQQQVQKAEWLAEEGKWKVTIKHVDGSDKVASLFCTPFLFYAQQQKLTDYFRSTKKR